MRHFFSMVGDGLTVLLILLAAIFAVVVTGLVVAVVIKLPLLGLVVASVLPALYVLGRIGNWILSIYDSGNDEHRPRRIK